MTKLVRFTLHASLLVALCFVRPTWATSFSNDQSDLWWNPDENGWGIQFVQRGATIFATMFVYDSARNPTWYVATMNGSAAGGVLTFTGDLYATVGPWFGTVPYDPASFGATKVGTMTWTKSSGEPGPRALYNVVLKSPNGGKARIIRFDESGAVVVMADERPSGTDSPKHQ